MSTVNAWSLPETLNPPLSGRDAVTDAVYRAILGFNTNDVNLIKSALTEDYTFIVNGHIMQGLDKIVTELFAKIAKLDTTHSISNIRVNIDGAQASLTATSLAQHCRSGMGTDTKAEKYLAGALYRVDLLKQDGDVEVWKIANFKLQATWAQGDPSILS